VNAAMATTTASLLMMAGPLFLRRWGRTYTGEENELGHSPLGGHCKRKERGPKPTLAWWAPPQGQPCWLTPTRF
jgi:hypothetical protein